MVLQVADRCKCPANRYLLRRHVSNTQMMQTPKCTYNKCNKIIFKNFDAKKVPCSQKLLQVRKFFKFQNGSAPDHQEDTTTESYETRPVKARGQSDVVSKIPVSPLSEVRKKMDACSKKPILVQLFLEYKKFPSKSSGHLKNISEEDEGSGGIVVFQTKNNFIMFSLSLHAVIMQHNKKVHSGFIMEHCILFLLIFILTLLILCHFIFLYILFNFLVRASFYV